MLNLLFQLYYFKNAFRNKMFILSNHYLSIETIECIRILQYHTYNSLVKEIHFVLYLCYLHCGENPK